MSQRENQRIMLTKRLLREALLRLLEHETIQKISVTELCREAEINRATFYNHYGSQFDVLSEIKQVMVDELQAILETNQIEGECSTKQQLNSVCQYLWENAKVARLFFCNSDIDYEFARKLFLLMQTQDRGARQFFPSYDEESGTLMLTFIGCGVFALFRKWLMGNSQKSPAAVADLAYDMVMRCVAPPKEV